MELETIGKILIDLVRITIYDKLNGTKSLNKEELLQELPNFEKKAATFVTLTIDGNLRGCIGTLIPYNTLYDDLTSNALKAAFEKLYEPHRILHNSSKTLQKMVASGNFEGAQAYFKSNTQQAAQSVLSKLNVLIQETNEKLEMSKAADKEFFCTFAKPTFFT